MTNRTVVLDTSVLLEHGTKTFSMLPNSELVIPLMVIKELEGKKSDRNLGYMARDVLRFIIDSSTDITNPVKLDNGSSIRVEINHVEAGEYVQEKLGSNTNDTKILAVAYNLQEEGGDKVYLATRDIALTIFAQVLGVDVIPVEFSPGSKKHIDKMETYEIDWEDMAELYENKKVKLDLDVPTNSGIVLKSGNQSALAIAKPGYSFTLVKDQTVDFNNHNIKPLVAKSKEQNVAIKMLRDDTIKLVSLGGVAGSGKTTIILAEAFRQVFAGQYKKVVVFRSMQSVGAEEIGFLPGDLQDKVEPWFEAIYDSLSSFLHKSEIERIKRDQLLEILPITHVRGRTLHNSYILVDEAQNLSLSTLATLVTRVSHSSKIALSHDISQKDNLHVKKYEGVYELVSRFLGNKLFGHVNFQKSERSELAQAAANLLG